MKLTKKQKADLETMMWFLPDTITTKPTEDDIKSFFDFSERGIRPKEETEGYKVLLEGKRWRGIHIGMYEEGILDLSVPYIVLVGGMPRSVVDFIKKNMFKGIDSELIEEVYVNLAEVV